MGLSLDKVLFKEDIWRRKADRSKGGRLESWMEAWRVSSLSFAMTEPEPFLGPLFFRAMSLVHLRPADRHRSQGSDFEHLTFLRRQASQGRSESRLAAGPACSSEESAIPKPGWRVRG